MPVSGPAAGMLGAAAGINAMLRGQIRGEMLRQERERQMADYGLREQQLDIQRQEIEASAQKLGRTPEQIQRDEIILKWRTRGIEALSQEEKTFIGLVRPASGEKSAMTIGWAIRIDPAYWGGMFLMYCRYRLSRNVSAKVAE